MKLNDGLLEKMMTRLTVLLVLISTGTLFYFLATRLGDVAKENQTYDRYNACVLSIPALERDQNRIDRCWTQVQQDTGREVKRYDKYR